jgi:Fic-DOC domain mobile mystery protein B
MSDVFGQPEGGATPLTAEETRDLKLSYIASRGELNVAEQENIARGQDWATRRRRRELLSEKFVCDLHRRMLGDVWKWAGRLRSSERNLGIPHWEIPVAIKELLADTKTWITTEAYAPDEIAVRFHHRLVQIHPFPNGNGRHARLMADLLITELGGKPFSWGRGGLRDHGELRRRYIAALQAADHHDIQPLLTFSRS